MSATSLPQTIGSKNAHYDLSLNHHHSVQFYEQDAILLDGLVPFIGSALGAGDSAIVIATKVHREGLANRLRAQGIDISVAVAQGRFMQLDAAETMNKFLVDSWPDAKLFRDVIGGTVERLAAAATSSRKEVAAFGEMVALLWSEGKAEAAIRLEQLWNELAQTHSFKLHCAYPIADFSDREHSEKLKLICAEHSAVFPTESYMGLVTEDERLRTVATLQQKANALERLAAERERLAVTLADEVEELRRIHDLATRMSWLDMNAVVRDVLKSVAAVHRTEMGLLSLRIPNHNELYPAASLGFSSVFLEQIARVPEGAGACGTCLQTRERVIVADTETDEIFAPYRDAARLAGFRSVHSTPLLDRSKQLVGVLSVHFKEPYCPSEREQRLTDLYARLAVCAIENARLYEALQDEFSQRKQAQQALIQAEKLAAAGRLAATIAHEINNPLEAVTNYLFLARKNPAVPPEVRRHLDIVDEELDRVAHIAQQTLGFYRDNSEPQYVEVTKSIEGVLTIYERKLQYKNLRVETDFTPDLNVWVLQGEFRQAISNLIANAIDASSDGGRILIRTHIRDSRACITIADTGVGMAREVKEKVFTPFFTTKEQVGTGLGLWTTKTLIEKHGGRVLLRSKELRGTVMSVILPCHASS
ncbi:MAG TPA: ATP-binding protein [Terriglobales bacterium]|nr:ATP-binding protein [Terriglobales bacterium]